MSDESIDWDELEEQVRNAGAAARDIEALVEADAITGYFMMTSDASGRYRLWTGGMTRAELLGYLYMATHELCEEGRVCEDDEEDDDDDGD